MSEAATLDAYGELIEPLTLKIQRLLPGPVDARLGPTSPRASCAASGWPRARWR